MFVKATLVAFMVLTICETGHTANEAIEILNDKNVSKFQKNMRIFSSMIYRKVWEETDADENIVFSPMSISHAMAMLNSGAGGNTTREIKKALHLKSKNSNAYVDTLMRHITEDVFTSSTTDNGVKTIMAARAFYAPGYDIKETYTASLESNYHSDVEEMNFIPSDAAANKINKWVADHTNDLIKDLVSRDMFTALTRMVLVNALYFKGPWLQGFQMTYTDQIFHAPSADVSMKFMRGESYYKYQETEDCIQVAVPYKDTKTEFVIIMPKSESAMTAFTEKKALHAYFKTLTKQIRGWEETRLKLFIPPFTIEKDMDVQKVLKTMGVQDLFDEDKADLSGISEEQVYVSDFVHKAKITVDKDGTEAAAGTAVVISARTIFIGQPVYINKPFIFAVVQDSNILFMGKVANPDA